MHSVSLTSLLLSILLFLSPFARAQDTKIPVDINVNDITVPAQSEFCKSQQTKHGLVPSNGTQIKAGSCSSTVIGSIPSFDNMVSTLIVSPTSRSTLDAQSNITVTIDILHLETGFFANAQTQYYLVPQTLNTNKIIEGHQHISVQFVGTATDPLDARTFAFFKGLNTASTDGRTLSVVIPAGTLKNNGVHRICSISGSFTHQPVVMPVAQRGAQDDCIRITITNAGSNFVGTVTTATAAAKTTTTTTTTAAAITTTTTTTTAAASAATGSTDVNSVLSEVKSFLQQAVSLLTS